jgi:pteridine reductase
VALVTGAGTRLGRAIAEELGRHGAHLAVHYFTSETGAQAATGPCDVVNILDIYGVTNRWRSEIPYTMSKAAAAELTRAQAVKLAPKIRVNAVAPGAVLPPVDLSPQELEALRQRIPQQRFGSAQDVADLVALLLTGPSFMTGQIVAVDGGRSLAL